ncbi:Bestrophin, RFP-TM, chloride channel-domain-containing protein [Mycena belliarum]|uniref:Bestrophin, RFP-TM, chloride channel-domain-containing protein n=1 Tax=Mycena belliarum TaxID=1033014 RepID=A0AAD6XLJ8_9AGAR|nr:Bestrophin, RFP-TM, chloride channel-domain-containing protein [Mycena belliae]
MQVKRSFSGRHSLLPAVKPVVPVKLIPEVPTFTLIAWTFGRGSVIWKIWPAVLVHTLFAAGVVYVWNYTGRTIDIPNVMLTVLGVVIGFVISYRAMSGYDRYWMGRGAWSDVIKNSRTMGRLIWYHTPPRLTVKARAFFLFLQSSHSTQTQEETLSGKVIRSERELTKAMAEKRMALDLVLAFAVALKHHLRGELGIYYDDLYDLVRPLHDHTHSHSQRSNGKTTQSPRVTSASHLPLARTPPPPSTSFGPPTAGIVYGTFDPARTGSRQSLKNSLRRSPSQDSTSSQHAPLLPGSNPTGEDTPDVARNLIPFAGMFASIRRWLNRKFGKKEGAIIASARASAEAGDNLPEEVLRCLSEWCSVLEDRNTVPGGSLGGIMGGIAAFEANLATLEHILTTPLPFVYAVHISTVWLYLFLLPFQLVSAFNWHTVPAVFVGSFIYLGFVAAGEEIEQASLPFGYDENDLDLDMFCQDIIKQDIESLKTAPCLNAYIAPEEPGVARPRHRSMTLVEATEHDHHDDFEDVSDQEV